MILDRERLTVYPRIFLALYVLLGGFWLFSGEGLLDRTQKPIGVDFITFYAASALTQAGRAPEVWNLEAITAMERQLIGAEIPPYAFHYPPIFLLALLPLASLPYLGALGVWWGATVASFVSVIRRINPDPATAGLALAFPGFFQNIIQGQNGAFTASILGLGLHLLDGRPAAAGAVLGMLAYKPQLAPLVGLGLLVSRRWRALGAMALSAGALAGLALALTGPEAWAAFSRNASFAVTVLETPGVLPWFRMCTVEVAALQLGAPVALARGLQAGSAVLSALAVVEVWRRPASPAARAGVLVAAILLSTPFGFDYDLAILGVPVAFLAWEARDGGLRRGELAAMVGAWVAPLAAPAIASVTQVSLVPPLMVGWIFLSLRRARGDS